MPLMGAMGVFDIKVQVAVRVHGRAYGVWAVLRKFIFA